MSNELLLTPSSLFTPYTRALLYVKRMWLHVVRPDMEAAALLWKSCVLELLIAWGASIF